MWKTEEYEQIKEENEDLKTCENLPEEKIVFILLLNSIIQSWGLFIYIMM